MNESSRLAVDLINALAWPVAAIATALIFRRPLGRFVESLGGRITKLSLFQMEVELVSAARPTAGPSLENIQRTLSPALLNDSSRMLFQQVQDTTPADYAVIDLGRGREWLTSRLFIGAAMLQRMRGVECLVFVEQAGRVERRFVALAPIARVRWALAQRYPWLEAALARSYAEGQPRAGAGRLPEVARLTAQETNITSATGALAPFTASQIVGRFIESIQRPPAVAGSSGAVAAGSSGPAAGTGQAAAPAPPAPPATAVPPTPPVQPAAGDSEWVTLDDGRSERAAWVTRTLLRELLPEDVFTAWADEARDAPRAERARAVLRRNSPFVALVGTEREFSRLIDRRALLEDLATRMDE